MSHLDRLKNGRDWSGYLTLENFDLVVDRLRAMIGDGQSYTWVLCHEHRRYQPEVRTNQKAREVYVSREPYEDGTPNGHVSVVDTYGIWGLRTSASDERAIADLPEKQRRHLTFKRDHLMIEHYAPIGAHMYWVVALEGGEG